MLPGLGEATLILGGPGSHPLSDGSEPLLRLELAAQLGPVLCVGVLYAESKFRRVRVRGWGEEGRQGAGQGHLPVTEDRQRHPGVRTHSSLTEPLLPTQDHGARPAWGTLKPGPPFHGPWRPATVTGPPRRPGATPRIFKPSHLVAQVPGWMGASERLTPARTRVSPGVQRMGDTGLPPSPPSLCTATVPGWGGGGRVQRVFHLVSEIQGAHLHVNVG